MVRYLMANMVGLAVYFKAFSEDLDIIYEEKVDIHRAPNHSALLLEIVNSCLTPQLQIPGMQPEPV